MVADFPTLSLEVAFFSDPGDASPTWTDLSSRLRSGSVNRGRQRELERYQAGRATFVLDNRDRALDPLYGANLFSSLSGARDATFEGGIGSWVAQANATVAHTTVQAKSGTGALQVTATAGSIDASAHSPTVPVAAGQTYTGIISGRAVATSREVDLRFLWYDVAGNQLNDSTFGTFTDVTGSWTTGTVTATAPSGAAEAALSLAIINPAASEVHRFDEAGILRSGTTWETPVFYAGRVVPMKRIRLRAVYAAVTYPVFDGFVDSWDQNYRQPRESFVEVSATDAFKVLAAAELPSSVYVVEVLEDEVDPGDIAAWWRLGEPSGSTQLLDSKGTRHLEIVGSPTLSAAGLIVNESNAAVQLTSADQSLTGFFPAPAGAPGMTVEFLYNGTSSGSNISMFYLNTLDGRGITVAASTSAIFFYIVGTVATGATAAQAAINILDNQTHHLAFVWEAGGAQKIYVDGVDRTTTAATNGGAGWAGVDTRLFLGKVQGAGGGGIAGTYDELVIYDREVINSRIFAHDAAARTPWQGDTPGGRIGRITTFLEWPAGLVDLDTGTSVLQSATLGGTALEHVQKVAESEFGALFVSRDGMITLVERDNLVNQTSQGTFGDGAGELVYSDIDFEYSDATIRNDVIVSRFEGSAQRVEDQTSIATYLRHSFTLDGLLHDSDVLSRTAAEFILADGKDPKLRVTSLALAPRRAPSTLFPAVLDRELTDWVTARRRPQNVGSVIDQVGVVEGITHAFNASKNDWRTTLQLSPAHTTTYWLLGVAGFSELGVTTRLGV